MLAGLGYRAWDRGVFEAGQGEAFEPWQNWRGNPKDGPKQPLNAAILAANPHDTQPWLFQAAGESITVLADRARNLGSFDPFRREMHLGVGLRDREPDARRRRVRLVHERHHQWWKAYAVAEERPRARSPSLARCSGSRTRSLVRSDPASPHQSWALS
ncbi:MAG: hypothetical protein WDM89_11160 [Rhizomicrobium sp.]